MEEKLKELEKRLNSLIENLDKLSLKYNDLEKRLKDLETGSLGTGVYLDGTPDYVKDYINKEGE